MKDLECEIRISKCDARRRIISNVVRLLPFHRTIAVGCVLVLCLLTPIAFGQSERIGAYQFRASKNNRAVRIEITNGLFDSSKHKIGYDKNIGNLVDGRVAYGAEAVPRTQIKSIALFFDGERVNVPRWLYADCYNPNLESEHVKLRIASDLQTVFVTMDGADGAGGYTVVWALRRNGRHTRFFRTAF